MWILRAPEARRFELVKWPSSGFVRKLLKVRGKFRERSVQGIRLSFAKLEKAGNEGLRD